MTARECKHLLQVNNVSYSDRINLLDNKIHELGQDNQFKILKNETITECIEIMVIQNVPTVVQWQDGNYVHISIFDFNIQSRPVLMRRIVSFNRLIKGATRLPVCSELLLLYLPGDGFMVLILEKSIVVFC